MSKHLHVGLSAVLIAGGLLWLSTIIWPIHPTATWRWVPELQASAFLGAVVLFVGVGVLTSVRRGFVFGLVVLLALLVVPRIPAAFFSPDATTHTRVFALNTYFAGADDGQVAQVINELRPDIVFLSETNPEEVATVARGTGMIALTKADPGPEGADGVAALVTPQFGKESGAFGEVVTGVTRFQMPRVYAPLRDNSQFVGIHNVAPVGSDRSAWVDGLSRLTEWSNDKKKLVVAGDFNATRGHRGFREFALTSCTGHFAQTPTWPSSTPVIRLDHILTTGQCLDGGAVKVAGTDHRGVWADVTT
ncbi:endonuclease/exonuclease/phosphatase family protein [Corynebacterium falsenii]|uniref:endonuclease/exonuclease/phosphatase family protein n=1 Tax=Corynebacterium falsenii TaxID=108486 RepID=UPI00234C1B48|nr:endonuclease/exonuclease/phosphatase family protein [Corynebacterium falsenii]MDC7104293.1 endonuclease/exonuclease/phosphatase family protein [Corynebacterium falsenii]